MSERLQRGPVQSRLGPQRKPLEFQSSSRQDPDKNQFTPLTKTRAEIFELHADMFEAPRPMLKGKKRRSKDKYCTFHKDHGHDTEECRDLMTDIEHLVQEGALRKYQVASNKGGRKNSRRKHRGRTACGNEAEGKPQRDDRDDEGDDHCQYDGVVATITGLPSGTSSRSALKSEARRPPPSEPTHKRLRREETITFSDADPVPPCAPHTDPLVISVGIANKLVRRAHVDTGASVSILFRGCFDHLGIGEARLAPSPLPLRSFVQEETKPEGVITLPVTAGRAPRSSTQSVQFYVVRADSPYNVILGRDWLNAVRAVCSTYHLTVKIPTKEGVAVIRGDQKKAKECMQLALRGADTSVRPPQA